MWRGWGGLGWRRRRGNIVKGGRRNIWWSRVGRAGVAREVSLSVGSGILIGTHIARTSNFPCSKYRITAEYFCHWVNKAWAPQWDLNLSIKTSLNAIANSSWNNFPISQDCIAFRALPQLITSQVLDV